MPDPQVRGANQQSTSHSETIDANMEMDRFFYDQDTIENPDGTGLPHSYMHNNAPAINIKRQNEDPEETATGD
ncbi:hypothetical protein [Effusibacillus lacus]|uniref:Uncharacterized protein n=1 Tax=Effusibacillus lacus TaxID=1348429 RepID=A0A292YH45_9BACL|nr:hypothetical protein [Effusibacillus lacus]TCS69806.1 hypothetical protein EDD64_13538 [Effusibacillus lacus]GAX88888.1 hypothetical protein EFBL_0502 [Effusibacillus lacus]